MTLEHGKPLLALVEGQLRNSDRSGYSASRLNTYVSKILTVTTIWWGCPPNKAIRKEVFPHPVCPMIRLIQPFLKKTSSSMRRVNLRPYASSFKAHVKEECRMPMSSASSGGGLGNGVMVASSTGVYSSSNSAYRMVGQWTNGFFLNCTYVLEEATDTIEGNLAWAWIRVTSIRITGI